MAEEILPGYYIHERKWTDNCYEVLSYPDKKQNENIKYYGYVRKRKNDYIAFSDLGENLGVFSTMESAAKTMIAFRKMSSR